MFMILIYRGSLIIYICSYLATVLFLYTQTMF